MVAHNEAPVSMNVFVEVDGIGRVQVTARGENGQEAACRLYDSLAAVVAPKASEPDTLNRRLTQLLAKGTLKAVEKQDLALVERLHKAFVLAVTGAVAGPDEDGVWYVRSQADGERTYEIKGNTCTCPDFKRYALMGETHLCKHVLAARMVEKAVTA